MDIGGTKYKILHRWVRKHKPKTDSCQSCGLNKRLQLANISGEYRKDIDDYEWLCIKCHYEKYHRKYPPGHKCVDCGSEETTIEINGITLRWCCGRCSKCQSKYYNKHNRAKMTQYVRDWRARKRATNL